MPSAAAASTTAASAAKHAYDFASFVAHLLFHNRHVVAHIRRTCQLFEHRSAAGRWRIACDAVDFRRSPLIGRLMPTLNRVGALERHRCGSGNCADCPIGHDLTAGLCEWHRNASSYDDAASMLDAVADDLNELLADLSPISFEPSPNDHCDDDRTIIELHVTNDHDTSCTMVTVYDDATHLLTCTDVHFGWTGSRHTHVSVPLRCCNYCRAQCSRR